MRSLPRAGDLACTVSVVALLSCGGSPPPGVRLPESYADATTTVRDGERPPLTVIRREGDPLPVMALAVAHDAGPGWGQGLVKELDARLRKVGVEPRASLFTRGLVVSFEVGARGDVALHHLPRLVQEAATAASAEPGSTVIDPCDPLPTLQEKPPELGRQNVSLALVGPEARVEALAPVLTDGDSWPAGDVPTVSVPGSDLYVTHQRPGPQLSFAVVTDGSPRLHAARRALRQNPLLANVLREFPPGFSLTELSASNAAGSGCLWATFAANPEPTRKDAAALVAALRELFETELSRAPAESALLPALTASTAVEAAELAAWQGFASNQTSNTRRFIAVSRSKQAEKRAALTDPDFERDVKRARSAERLRVETRVEKGQGRIWAALTSNCPTAHETRNDAGYTALGFEHAARALAAREALSAWRGDGGPALVAHAPALRDGAEEAVANALAEGLLGSLEAGPELSLIARDELDAIDGADLVDFAAELLTRGHPSRVFPRGTRDSLSRVNPLHVRSALLGFLSTPLSLVVAANHDEAQGRRIAERLERLLSPFLPAEPSCPAANDAPVPGSYVMLLDEPRAELVLAFPIPLNQLGAARAVAFLLERKGGFLDQALVAADLTSRARARATGSRGGSAALFVAVDAQADAVALATQQVRALMQRISAGAIQEQHHRAVLEAWRPPPGRTPLERIFRGAEAEHAPSLDELRRFAHSYLTEEKLVVVHAGRRD